MTAQQATIYAALIGIVGTVLGALITTLGPRLFYLLHSKDRRFTGKWVGTAEDVAILWLQPDQVLKYQLTAELTRRGDLVSGQLSIRSGEPREFAGHCKVQCIEVSGDFIAFKYALTDQDVTHFGVALLELVGKDLEGFFLSKKIFEKKIGFGVVRLKRD